MINIAFLEKLYSLKTTFYYQKKKKVTAKIPSRCEATLLEDLSKSCYLKVKRRRKITEPKKCEFMDQIMFLITVFNELVFFILIS